MFLNRTPICLAVMLEGVGEGQGDTAHMQKSQDDLWELVLFFYHVSLYPTQAVRQP